MQPRPLKTNFTRSTKKHSVLALHYNGNTVLAWLPKGTIADMYVIIIRRDKIRSTNQKAQTPALTPAGHYHGSNQNDLCSKALGAATARELTVCNKTVRF